MGRRGRVMSRRRAASPTGSDSVDAPGPHLLHAKGAEESWGRRGDAVAALALLAQREGVVISKLDQNRRVNSIASKRAFSFSYWTAEDLSHVRSEDGLTSAVPAALARRREREAHAGAKLGSLKDKAVAYAIEGGIGAVEEAVDSCLPAALLLRIPPS
jgi:hypothetical protein